MPEGEFSSTGIVGVTSGTVLSGVIYTKGIKYSCGCVDLQVQSYTFVVGDLVPSSL